MKIALDKNFFISVIFLLCLIFSSLLLSPFVYSKPNILLVFLIILSFFISNIYIFSISSLLGILFSKYVPFFQIDYLIYLIIAILIFWAFRFLFSRNNFFVLVLMLAIAQLIVWISISGFSSFVFMTFILEYFYNCILMGLFFIIGLWLRKISY